MLGIAIAGLLATSLGNPDTIEPGKVSWDSVGLTARLRVAAAKTEVPNVLLRESLIMDAAPETTDRDAAEWNWHSNSSQPSVSASVAPEEPGGAGWIVGGVLVGTLNLGTAAAVASGVAHASSGLVLGVTISAGVAGGVGGYFLGTLARQGSSVAKVIIVTLTVLDVLVPVVGGLVATSSMHMNQGSLFGPRFTE